MKNRILVLFVGCFLSGYSGMNAQPVAHYFVQMPANLIPTVSIETRKDLVDFFNNGKSAAMPSVFGGEIVLKELSEDYLFLQTSTLGDLQLKLLQVNDTLRVIALVHTVAAPLKDSRISFYTTFWKPFYNIGFPQFSFLDFIDMEKAKELGLSDRLKEVSLRNFVSYKFKPKSSLLVVYTSLREDIRPEIRKDFESIIKDSIFFVWENSKFNLHNSTK